MAGGSNVATLVVAPTAGAKDGEVAHLLVAPPRHASAGTVVTVKWTVERAEQDGKATPFAAAGMFVRLVGRHGVSRTAVANQYEPPYSVRVVIPSGGVLKIELGLQGWASTATGMHYAPEFFPVH